MREIIKEKGKTSYYLNGVLHRLDGPAVERSDGINDWYIHGKMIGMQIREGKSNIFTYYIGTETYSEEKFKTKILYDLLQADVPNLSQERKKNKI